MYMVSENVNEVRWYVVLRIFLEKLHNLLRCFVHFAKSFANHALSEMMLLRGELWRITFDVVSRVRKNNNNKCSIYIAQNVK